MILLGASYLKIETLKKKNINTYVCTVNAVSHNQHGYLRVV